MLQDSNLEKTIEKLFSEPFGQGYPKDEAFRKLKDTALLKELRAKSQTDIIPFLNTLAPDLRRKLMSRHDVITHILENGRDRERNKVQNRCKLMAEMRTYAVSDHPE